MKTHNGMRPHDVVVLLKILSLNEEWLSKDLSASLFISPSEISESLNRSAFAGLISPDKKKVLKATLLGFLENGLRFVFPVQPGAITRGIPTAHSAPIFYSRIVSDEIYVWPSPTGTAKGQSITPLYPNQVTAVLQDERLYAMLALVDSIRIGKAREVAKAMELLEKFFAPTYA